MVLSQTRRCLPAAEVRRHSQPQKFIAMSAAALDEGKSGNLQRQVDWCLDAPPVSVSAAVRYIEPAPACVKALPRPGKIISERAELQGIR